MKCALDQLKTRFALCQKFCADDPEAVKFFKLAKRLVSGKRISVLRISDFNTTGLEGDDEDRTKPWYNLIRRRGSSSKLGGEGGSFGIGKHAPFATSQFRTVFYSTKSRTDGFAFMGVSRLVTHEAGETKHDSVGYLSGGGVEAVRSASNVPKPFRRTKLGTDVFVIGVNESYEWESELTRSVLEHFFPAIHNGKLEVTVGRRSINAKNLAKLMTDTAKGAEGFTAHNYFEAINAGEVVSKSLTHLKDVSLYLTRTEKSLQRVALVRKTGMVIKNRTFRGFGTPFCGVFVCENDTGNEILRRMEPPCHDEWDKNRPDRGASTKYEREYVRFIRDALKSMLAQDDSDVIELDEFSRFLPALPGDGRKSQGSGHSSEDSKRFPLSTPKQKQPGIGGKGGGDQKGKGKKGSSGDNKGSNGDQGGNKTPIAVTYRAFPESRDNQKYKLVLRSADSKKHIANLKLAIVGDQGAEPLRIAKVAMKNGRTVPFEESGAVGPVRLRSSEPTVLIVTLAEPMRASLEIVANEDQN